MNGDAVIFHETGKWVNKWFSFKDIDGNYYPPGKYWEIGYQVGIGVLLANDEKIGTARFFTEKMGLPVFIGKEGESNNLWLILLLVLVIGYFILKRK
jgi:hypothetical protein